MTDSMIEAPYPPDIKARGWGFDIDIERIEASDTWALAGTELRPWLLMTWITAWRSQPVGTMPASPRLFAARIGMPWAAFQDAAEVLMRGWVLHADGLLYHPVITERVLAMAEKRLKDRDRVAAWRANSQPGNQPGNALQTSNASATDADVARDQHVSTTPLPLPLPTPLSIPIHKEGRALPQSGSRLPTNWTLPDDWAAWAKEARPDLLPSETAARFADYWHGVAGARARKVDWLGTWRNWVRGERAAPNQARNTNRNAGAAAAIFEGADHV